MWNLCNGRAVGVWPADPHEDINFNGLNMCGAPSWAQPIPSTEVPLFGHLVLSVQSRQSVNRKSKHIRDPKA